MFVVLLMGVPLLLLLLPIFQRLFKLTLLSPAAKANPLLPVQFRQKAAFPAVLASTIG